MLHLLLCTVNTTAAVTGCGCSSAQCQWLHALFNDAVSLLRYFVFGGERVSNNGGMILTGETEVLGEKLYTVWVVDGWISMEQWWNDTDRGKLKYWEKNII